jgi:alpha-methylacyl-CoA racemase
MERVSMGPLKGLRIIEMAGIGPAPFCSMLLADMGAEVLRIDRLVASDIGIPVPPKYDLLNRNKRSAAIDIKSADGLATVRRLAEKADVLIEGFRPGVMERLGLGPADLRPLNRRLVYGRMTGWGQDGPLARAAGHDLNYIALSGVLSALGRKGERPAIPLNLIGDFGAGSLYLAMGVLAAVMSARESGTGQVVDAAIVDGAANLLTLIYGYKQMGAWINERGVNVTDGGAPFYDVYETKDKRYISVAPVEKKFYLELLERIGLANDELPDQNDRSGWDRLRVRLADVFKRRTRDEWCAMLEGTDACFAPVLDMDECVTHPHNIARKTHVVIDGVMNPAPAPRFSETPSTLRKVSSSTGEDTEAALSDWGFSREELDVLKGSAAIR